MLWGNTSTDSMRSHAGFRSSKTPLNIKTYKQEIRMDHSTNKIFHYLILSDLMSDREILVHSHSYFLSASMSDDYFIATVSPLTDLVS